MPILDCCKIRLHRRFKEVYLPELMALSMWKGTAGLIDMSATVTTQTQQLGISGISLERT